MKQIIIDCDIGVDDASAVIMLLKNDRKVCIQLLSTVAGNVKIENVLNNSFFVANTFSTYPIKIAKGAEKPLKTPRIFDASNVHGENGLGGLKLEKQFYDNYLKNSADEEIFNILNKSKKKITILAVGPLTNIALLLTKHPEIAKKIKRLIIMGGSISGIGNITPYAEYNFAWDTDAVEVVLKSDLKIYLSPIENANNMPVDDNDVNFNLTDKKHSLILQQIFLKLKDANLPFGFALHDSCVSAYLLKPRLFKTLKCDIKITNDKKDKTCGQCFCVINKFGKNYVFIPKNYEKVKNFILKTTFGG